MPIKDIAAVVQGEDAQSHQVDVAISIAADLSAYIIGINLATEIGVVDLALDSLSRGNNFFDEFPQGTQYFQYTTIDGELNDLMKVRVVDRMLTAYDNLESYFLKALRPRMLRGEWHLLSGRELLRAAAVARRCDLIILPAPDDGDTVAHSSEHLVRSLLFLSDRPRLHLPNGSRSVNLANGTVMIGWDGSRAARRAATDALPLLQLAKTVEVLEIDSFFEETEGDGFVEHLERHGVRAKLVNQTSSGGSVSDALLRRADMIGADLLVVGAFGHSRLRELIVGSVTHGLIKDATMPIFLSR